MVLSFALLVTCHLTQLYHTSLSEGELLAQKQSIIYIDDFEKSINHYISTLEAVRSAMLTMRSDSLQSRDNVVHLLEELVRDNPYLLSTYTLWEPNAFDNSDDAHRSARSYEDATGQFLPYVVRNHNNDTIEAVPLVDFDIPGKGDFYQIPKQTKQFALLEPYYYKVNGEDILMTSFVLPILDKEGQFLGIIGADVSLETVQNKVADVRPLEGYANIITSDHNYLVNSQNKELNMKPYVEWPGGQSFDHYGKDTVNILYTPDQEHSGEVLRMFYPITIKQYTWHFEMVIPKANILSRFYKSMLSSILISVAALITITTIMMFLVEKIVRHNMKQVVEVSSALASGIRTQKLNIRTNDEFEYMAGHFNRMIDYREETEQLVQHQAMHDLLTGLPNRYGFSLYLHDKNKVSEEKTVHTAMLYIDIDGFKLINDTLDYAMGDLLLKQVAERIADIIDTQGKVFRFGGDEFVVLMEEVRHLNQAIIVAEDILARISEPVEMNGRLFYMTASIGMSVQHEWNAAIGERLMKESDIALYVAKKQRNMCTLYSPSMNDVPTKELVLENSLFKALENNQFLLYYQPKVELSTGEIYGAEALLRWKHPDLGMISPLEFIPLAEKTGFIIELGEWVLRTACMQIKQWEQEGITSLSVSVNMSMIQFQQKHIVATIEKIIAETGIRPEQLELELTESIFMDNPEHTLKILHDIQLLGIKLSLDDFGTGYSSLSYLQSIPLHYLKLDKTFIHDIVTDIKKQMIFKSLIVIAHNLNMKVVTEGVESQDELQIIREHNCDLVQGYIYSPPVSPERFTDLYYAANR